MERSLSTHQVNYILALEYVKDCLEGVNILSNKILNLLNFESGYFFTLLPENANFHEINHFKWGGILPQFPEKEHIINGKRSTYTWIPDIDNELSLLILNKINSNPILSCVIDKVIGTAGEKCYNTYSEANPLFYDSEVYFHLSKKNISIEIILKCLKASNSFWHSLCVFTTADLNGLYKTITLEKIKEICEKTELIMVGAYDGEGYVFWEKAGTNFFQDVK